MKSSTFQEVGIVLMIFGSVSVLCSFAKGVSDRLFLLLLIGGATLAIVGSHLYVKGRINEVGLGGKR